MIEEKLDRLATAIERLADALSRNGGATAAVAATAPAEDKPAEGKKPKSKAKPAAKKAEKAEPEPEPVEAEEAKPEVTQLELRNLGKKVIAVPELKNQLKDWLGERNLPNLSALSADQRVEAKSFLESLLEQ